MTNFPERLSELCKSKNVMKKTVAEMLGVTYRTVNNYENGQREPTIEQLRKLADFFEVSMDYLTGRSNDPTPLSMASGTPWRSPEQDEEAAFQTWAKENLVGAFFYDYDSDSDQMKKEMMNALREVWKRERGRKPGQKQGE